MAKVLQNFLIGVGLETENYDKGAKNVESSLSRMRSLTGITGAAIAGAFAFAGTAAVNAGVRVDRYALAFEKLKASPDWIYNYGNALKVMGGDAEEALSAVNAAENALAEYRLKGNFGSFQEAAFAGVRDELFSLSNSTDGGDFLRQLADIVPKMDKDQQRLIQDAWGLSDAVMRSLRGGVNELDAAVAKAGSLAGGFTDAVEASREFNRSLAEVNLRFEGLGNTLAEKVLPGFTGMLDSFGGFIDKHKDTIGGAIDAAAKNPVSSTLIAGGAGAAIAGSGLKAVGLKSAGSALSRLGLPAMAIGAGAWAWDKRPEDIEALTGYKPSNYIFDKTPLDAAQDAWKWASDKWNGKNSVENEGRVEYQPIPQSPVMIHSQPEPKGIELIVLPNPYPAESDKQDKREQQSYLPAAPVYEGFQIDSKESAAITSPDFTLIKELIEQNSRPQTPQKVSVNNSIDLTVEIEGRAFDSRVTDVIERRERDTMEDVFSVIDR